MTAASLPAKPEPAIAPPTLARAAAEEALQRHRERNGAEGGLERGAVSPLTALEGGAFLALAQVGAEGAALGLGDRALEPARERDLGLATREAALELLAQGAAGAEEQAFRRR